MDEIAKGEIYLEPEEEKIKNAAEIAAVSESMEKFIFTVFYALSDKEVILAEVNSNTGRIVAKKAGNTTITVTTNDGSYVASCALTVDYCGGSDYRNVTKHNMVLQNDGYYVCTRCGYRIKSPELEDKDILSTDDYLKIIATMHYYTQVNAK